MASITSNASGGTTNGAGTAWANMTNLAASDNARANATNITAAGTSQVLRTTHSTDFAAIGDSDTIDGIQLRIERNSENGQVKDQSIRLATGGVAVGDDKADTATLWPTSAGETYAIYGGPTDKWGRTWTGAEVKNGLSAWIQAVNTNATNTRTASIDHVELTVSYTPAATTGRGRLIGGERNRLVRS